MRTWKFLRFIGRAGRQSDVRPVLAVLIAVLVPAVCLLWFMSAAMRNERFAARQQLTDVYHAQLVSLKRSVDEKWNDRLREFEACGRLPPAAAFLKCTQSGLIETAVILDPAGSVVYPDRPDSPPDAQAHTSAQWTEGHRHEYVRKDPLAAAECYASVAAASSNINITARALQAQVRCLRRAGRNDAALEIIINTLLSGRFDQATDRDGRLIVPNVELMAIELLAGAAPAESIALHLQRRVNDYDNPAMAASQRLFLMKELKRLRPSMALPTLRAEELAAEWREHGIRDSRSSPLQVQPSLVPGLWQFTTADHRVLALFRAEKLILSDDAVMPHAEVSIVPPNVEREALVSIALGPQFPGWRLALAPKDPAYFTAATKDRTAIYLWTAVLAVAVVCVLTVAAVRLLRRQVAVARLKNDLAATVSHELKTPLASMRILVDTLLHCEKFDEGQVREYLKLVAGENERLTRLVQNFLTFSRMDRAQHTFRFDSVSPGEVVEAATRAVAERLDAPGCRLHVKVEPNVPDVTADREAITTALVNLLDNACKYSGDIKRIEVRAWREGPAVHFSVQDNGIGIARREIRKVFRRYYQVDQRLSRERDGCGLGLSIVEFIVTGHRGRVLVQSQPGRGSTFTIVLPAATDTTHKQEAIA